jgi:hypothetical protein
LGSSREIDGASLDGGAARRCGACGGGSEGASLGAGSWWWCRRVDLPSAISRLRKGMGRKGLDEGVGRGDMVPQNLRDGLDGPGLVNRFGVGARWG